MPRRMKMFSSPLLKKTGNLKREGSAFYLTFSRRKLLIGIVGLVPLIFSKARPTAAAVADKLLPLVHEVTEGKNPKVGRVKLTLPMITESGNSVPLKVQVESPMTADNYVKSIHILSEKNPRPVIARFYLNSRSGKAEIRTRIRLAGSQHIWAVAVMSDGSSWLGSAEVVVTAGACVAGT